MATVQPFAALLPRPDLASRICEPPYDVLSSEEARALASGNPWSFLRVSKPEIDLAPGTNPYGPEVYARGRTQLDRLVAEGALAPDTQPCFHLYRQTLGNHQQTGVVVAASCQEYRDGVIRRHELTRVDKEDDRVRHIDALDAQTGPVFLIHPSGTPLDEWVAARTAGEPRVDFVAPDGVRHTAWRVADAEGIAFLRETFALIPRLYIADGHHRSAAAARVFEARGGAGGSDGFLAVSFPHRQLRILPYNRVLKDLNGHRPEAFLRALETVAEVQAGGPAEPLRKHQVGMFLGGAWYGLTFRKATLMGRRGIEALDVSILQQAVLQPLLGIDDPRTSERIQFVGGARGVDELERRVQSGEFACAFSMYPTGVEDLMEIADAGGIMPPKSTWFEPKLRDAMFCLRLGD